MPPRKKDPRKQYFEAIRAQKLDTLRWCLRHGGVSVTAQDEEGATGVQIAAAGGFSDSLECLIENVKKVGQPSDLEEADDDGQTPLMMAAHAGKLECVRLLVLQGKVKVDAKDEAGKTARALAVARKLDKVVAFLDNPSAPPEEEAEEEVDPAEEERRRVFLAAKKAAGPTAEQLKQEAVHRQRVEAAEALERALASSAPPVWPEVEPILKETRRELSIRNKPALTAASGPVDPALWNCVCLFELRLEIAERALTRLPPQIARLVDLVTLIVSGNALSELPDEVAQLTKLRNLEAAGNELIALPASISRLTGLKVRMRVHMRMHMHTHMRMHMRMHMHTHMHTHTHTHVHMHVPYTYAILKVVDVSNNKLHDLAPLAKLTELVAVNAGHNALVELPLYWEKLEHMQTLAAPHNQIVSMPAGLGALQMLVSLDLAANAIEQVPIELGNLTVKKLQAVKLQGNPLADARIRRFVEEDTPTLVKDLLNHVRKNGFKGEAAAGGAKKGGGGKKGKKGKGKAAAVEEDEEGDEDANIAELLAQMGGGSDDDEPVNVS